MRKTVPESMKESCFCRSFIERLENVDRFESAPGVSGLPSREDGIGDRGAVKAG